MPGVRRVILEVVGPDAPQPATGGNGTTVGARAVGVHERGSDRRPQLGRGRKPVPCR